MDIIFYDNGDGTLNTVRHSAASTFNENLILMHNKFKPDPLRPNNPNLEQEFKNALNRYANYVLINAILPTEKTNRTRRLENMRALNRAIIEFNQDNQTNIRLIQLNMQDVKSWSIRHKITFQYHGLSKQYQLCHMMRAYEKARQKSYACEPS